VVDPPATRAHGRPGHGDGSKEPYNYLTAMLTGRGEGYRSRVKSILLVPRHPLQTADDWNLLRAIVAACHENWPQRDGNKTRW